MIRQEFGKVKMRENTEWWCTTGGSPVGLFMAGTAMIRLPAGCRRSQGVPVPRTFRRCCFYVVSARIVTAQSLEYMEETIMRMRWASFIVTVGLVLISLSASFAAESWSFVQVCDPQIVGSAEAERFSTAINQINASDAKLMLVCGDLVNEAGNPQQTALLKSCLKRAKVPVRLVPGNHDVGQAADEPLCKKYRKEFGKDYYTFKRNGTLFIALNSSLLQPSDSAEAQRQWKWLERKLARKLSGSKRDRFEHVVIFMHHPPFIQFRNEEDSYGNLALASRTRLLDLAEKYKVSAILTGHAHQNIVRDCGGMLLVTTSATSFVAENDKLGYRIWTVEENALTHKFVPLEK